MSHTAPSELERSEGQWPAYSVFMGWDKPEEPPIDLYRRGSKFQIRSHVPPTYTEIENYTAARKYPRRRKASLAELSHQYPPTAGGRVGPPIELELCSPIRTGASFDTQLFKVKVPIFPEPRVSLAAKFYDPLRTWDSEDPEVDPFKHADRSYTTEATAYEYLRLLEGTMVPRYLGSYTFDAPTGWSTETRSIRLILYEFVQGIVMRDLPPEMIPAIPQDIRKTIMYQVVQAESRIWALDVHHCDSHPRNTVLRTDARPVSMDDLRSDDLKSWLSDPSLSVRYIDFDNARFGGFTTNDIPYRSPGQGDKPVSPILRWSGTRGRVESFLRMGWVDWDWQRWLEDCWGDSTFYTPITLELEDKWIGPRSPKVFTDQRHRVVSVRDLIPQTQTNKVAKIEEPSQVDNEITLEASITAASDTDLELNDSTEEQPSDDSSLRPQDELGNCLSSEPSTEHIQSKDEKNALTP